jgi:hypothetical protein
MAEEPISVSVMMVPATVPEFTFTTSEKLPDDPEFREAMVQLTLPVPLTAGVEQLQPPGTERD